MRNNSVRAFAFLVLLPAPALAGDAAGPVSSYWCAAIVIVATIGGYVVGYIMGGKKKGVS